MFEGHYEAYVHDGKIQKIFLMQNQTPIALDTEAFLKNHALTLKSFDSYEISKNDAKNESVRLKTKDGQSVGTLQIQRDDQGRVLSIEVR